VHAVGNRTKQRLSAAFRPDTNVIRFRKMPGRRTRDVADDRSGVRPIRFAGTAFGVLHGICVRSGQTFSERATRRKKRSDMRLVVAVVGSRARLSTPDDRRATKNTRTYSGRS